MVWDDTISQPYNNTPFAEADWGAGQWVLASDPSGITVTDGSLTYRPIITNVIKAAESIIDAEFRYAVLRGA